MDIQNFVEFLFNEVPPCEKFRCENLVACQNNMLACEAFYHWVQSGHSHSPRKSRYSFTSGKIFASKAIFQQIYQE
jgi:hypothetical protein